MILEIETELYKDTIFCEVGGVCLLFSGSTLVRCYIAVSGGKDGCTSFVEFVFGVIAKTRTTQELTQKTTQ